MPVIALIGPEAVAVQYSARNADRSMTAANADLEIWEHHIESELDRDPASALITVSNFARPGILLEIQGVAVIEQK